MWSDFTKRSFYFSSSLSRPDQVGANEKNLSNPKCSTFDAAKPGQKRIASDDINNRLSQQVYNRKVSSTKDRSLHEFKHHQASNKAPMTRQTEQDGKDEVEQNVVSETQVDAPPWFSGRRNMLSENSISQILEECTPNVSLFSSPAIAESSDRTNAKLEVRRATIPGLRAHQATLRTCYYQQCKMAPFSQNSVHQISTIPCKEEVSFVNKEKSGSILQMRSPSTISMKLKTAGKRVLQPLMKTWMKTLLMGPRLLSSAPYKTSTVIKPTTIRENNAASESAKSSQEELMSDENKKHAMQISRKRRSQREKTPHRSFLGNFERKKNYLESTMLQTDTHTKKDDFFKVDQSIKKIDFSKLRDSASSCSTTKQREISPLNTPRQNQFSKQNKNSPRVIEQGNSGMNNEQCSEPLSTIKPLRAISDDEFQALVSEQVQKCISSSFSCGSFKSLVLKIVREEVQSNYEKGFTSEREHHGLSLYQYMDGTTINQSGIASEPCERAGNSCDSASLVFSPTKPVTTKNVCHKNAEDKKLFFADSQFSGLSSLTDNHVTSHQSFPLSQMEPNYVMGESLVAQCSTAYFSNNQAIDTSADLTSKKRNLNRLASQNEMPLYPSKKMPSNFEGNQMSSSLNVVIEAVPEEILPVLTLQHENSLHTTDTDFQNKKTEGSSLSGEKEKGKAEKLWKSSANVTKSKNSTNNIHQVTPVVTNRTNEKERGKPNLIEKEKESSLLVSSNANNLNIERKGVNLATKLSPCRGSSSWSGEEIVPETAPDTTLVAVQKKQVSINKDTMGKKDIPAYSKLTSREADSSVSMKNRYHLRSKGGSSDGTKKISVHEKRPMRKECARWSSGIKLPEDETNSKPSATQHVVKRNKRRQVKGRLTLKHQANCHQLVDDNEVFCFTEPLDDTKEATKIVNTFDNGCGASKKRTLKTANLIGRNSYKKPRLASWFGF